jgi:signal transduction histidine kinase/HAMP domain-containing protein
MFFKSLRFKINAAILVTAVIIAVLFAAILYPFEVNRRKARFEKIEILLGAVFEQKKEELANEIFAEQKLALANTLREIREVKGVAGLSVYDLAGDLLMGTDQTPAHPLPVSERKALAKASFSFGRVKGDRHLAEYASAIEVIGERVGYLKIYFDLEDVERASLLNVIIFSTLFVSTLLIMSVLLNLLLSRAVIKPVSLLRDAINKVQRGNLGEQVRLPSKDEIGEMASSFNDMSLKLHEQREAIETAIKAKDSYAVELEKTNRELENLNVRLEDIVDERTAELRESYEKLQEEIIERKRADREKMDLEERLARSQKMEALGLLAGGVAHDLNNVLSGTVSYPDLLLMDLPPDSPLRKPIMTIRDSGQKAAAIVQDLLTLARRGVMNTETMNLSDIVSEYLRSPEHEKLVSYHSSVAIETRLESDLLNIKGSPLHLKKALMNLVSNAAEAQPEGGKILISSRNQYVDKPIKGYDNVQVGDFVVLSVTDRGTGIAPDDFKRIFEPFYTKKVMGRSGTGLGMSVVWGTVQDHGGYINIKSKEGKGTTFELYFPVTREEILKRAGAIPPEEYAGSGETVLVVDDIREQREIASVILAKLGYTVLTASNGEEAVEYLKDHSVHILVLDMIMDPGMDGLDTYTRILTIHPHQKAIIASGFAETDRVKEAQKLGAGKYIRKPYTLEKLGLALKGELGIFSRNP